MYYSENAFRIDKVIQQMRKTDGTRLAWVKWVGYGSSYNSWIPEGDIINYIPKISHFQKTSQSFA